MEWENKIEMIRVHNQTNGSSPEFKAFVIEHIDELDNDAQAVDMLMNCIELIPDEMDKEFCEKIYEKTKTIELNKIDSFHTAMRVSMFNTICEQKWYNHES